MLKVFNSRLLLGCDPSYEIEFEGGNFKTDTKVFMLGYLGFVFREAGNMNFCKIENLSVQRKGLCAEVLMIYKLPGSAVV